MKSIVGIYSDVGSATDAVRALNDAHVDTSEIAVTEVTDEGRRELSLETRTGERALALRGAVVGAALYAVVVGLLEADVIVDPGIGFVADSLAVTLGRVVVMGGGAGALTGYVMGLAVWQIEIGGASDPAELAVRVRVSERRLAEMKAVFERTGATRVEVEDKRPSPG